MLGFIVTFQYFFAIKNVAYSSVINNLYTVHSKTNCRQVTK
jgi:hypothetical protein